MSNRIRSTKLGIVEGFYGHPYEEAHRLYLMERAAAMGFSFYIYAPKNDPLLRRSWRDAPSEDDARRLRKHAAFGRDHGIAFTFALSPLGIDYDDPADIKRAVSKVQELLKLTRAPFFGVFFDDIRADAADLGVQQGQLLQRLKQSVPEDIAIVCCPSFYSFDPILEKIFGKRPGEYFADLTKTMPQDVIMCWTGNKVLSPEITAEDLVRAEALLERPICIWDNYPVNDGKNFAEKIFLSSFKDRSGIDGHALMHAVNPMTEAALSCVPLTTLPYLYAEASPTEMEQAREHELQALFGNTLSGILPLLERCERDGRSALDEDGLMRMRELVELMPNALAAEELRGYLAGRYAFDPQCLTS